jgi:phosphate transport system substrate-binding protein
VNRTRWRSSLVVGAAATLALAACTGDGGSSGDGGTGGFVSIHGSSTVKPITDIVAEDFADANAGFDFEVGGEGTGAGFADFFCADESDISDASRPISEEEIAQCEEAGIEYVELKVAYDGMSVLTSVENADVTCLSFLDLYALLGPESEGFATWADANDLAAELADELGDEFGASHAPYPEADLVITAPGEESGTFDSFVELVIEGIGEARGIPEAEWTTRPDYQSSGDDNVIIQGITGSPTSLGWVGFAYAEENADTVKEIEVDGGAGCTSPTVETIADASYPLSRALYVYVNAGNVADNAALAPFVDFYLGEGYGAVAEAGYVELPDDELEGSRSTWADAQ